MLNILPNVLALNGPYNTGPVTVIGYFLYLLYSSVFIVRVVINRSRGKTFNVVHELLAFSAVYALVLALFLSILQVSTEPSSMPLFTASYGLVHYSSFA